MNTTNGKIAVQSKQKMAQALLRLMEQYDYKEITVTQIAQEARLSRKTFYRLFSDKDDVLAVFFDGLFHEYFSQIQALNVPHYWEVMQLFFDFWETRKELLFLLQKNHLLSRVFEQSYQYSMQIFTFVRSQEIVDSFSLSLPYILAYSVGGLHSMLLKWVERGMDIPSADLIAQLKAGFKSDDL